MPISFNDIPNNIRVPLFYVELDPSQAGTPQVDQRALMIGQMFDGGSADAGVPVAVGSAATAKAFFGEGSMLERMVAAFRKANLAQELWCLPVAEPAGGTAATGKITVTAAAVQPGTIALYIAGQKVAVSVGAGDSDEDIAAAIVAAINAKATLPVTAAVNGENANEADLTARWTGTTGDDIQLSLNYHGLVGGEQTPGGVTLTITAMDGGAGTPDLTDAIAALGDDPYEYVAFPWTDATSLDAIRDEYGFGDEGRWGWMRQLYGHVISAKRDTYQNLLTFGATRNDGVISIAAVEPAQPSPVWEQCAADAAIASRALMLDPARPLQTLDLPGILPAPKGQRFIWVERNSLLHSGLATHYVDEAGVQHVERMITTYQSNALGQEDDALLDITTLATAAYIQRDMKRRVTSKFPRHKLANNGTRFGAGQAVVTPNIVEGELIAHYRELEELALVENADLFKQHLIVDRDATDPNRLNVLYPPDFVNQLRVFAVQNQFRLEYNRAAL